MTTTATTTATPASPTILTTAQLVELLEIPHRPRPRHAAHPIRRTNAHQAAALVWRTMGRGGAWLRHPAVECGMAVAVGALAALGGASGGDAGEVLEAALLTVGGAAPGTKRRGGPRVVLG